MQHKVWAQDCFHSEHQVALQCDQYKCASNVSPQTRNLENSSDPKQVVYLKLHVFLKLYWSSSPSPTAIRCLLRKWYRRSIRCWWTGRTPAIAPASPFSSTETCWTTSLSSSPSRVCRRARCSKWWKVRDLYLYLGLWCYCGAKKQNKRLLHSLKRLSFNQLLSK